MGHGKRPPRHGLPHSQRCVGRVPTLRPPRLDDVLRYPEAHLGLCPGRPSATVEEGVSTGGEHGHQSQILSENDPARGWRIPSQTRMGKGKGDPGEAGNHEGGTMQQGLHMDHPAWSTTRPGNGKGSPDTDEVGGMAGQGGAPVSVDDNDGERSGDLKAEGREAEGWGDGNQHTDTTESW
eukprot:232912-Rhodomonas_salina.3